MSQSKGRIDALASTLQDWMRGKFGMSAPLPEEISEVIEKHFKDFGVKLVAEETKVEEQVAALLKPSKNSSDVKRMRELAGIPHKGNYV